MRHQSEHAFLEHLRGLSLQRSDELNLQSEAALDVRPQCQVLPSVAARVDETPASEPGARAVRRRCTEVDDQVGRFRIRFHDANGRQASEALHAPPCPAVVVAARTAHVHAQRQCEVRYSVGSCSRQAVVHACAQVHLPMRGCP